MRHGDLSVPVELERSLLGCREDNGTTPQARCRLAIQRHGEMAAAFGRLAQWADRLAKCFRSSATPGRETGCSDCRDGWLPPIRMQVRTDRGNTLSHPSLRFYGVLRGFIVFMYMLLVDFAERVELTPYKTISGCSFEEKGRD